METLSTLIKVSLPNYLKELPVPNSVTGLAKLSAKDWLTLTPFVGTVSFLVYVTVQAFHQPRPPIEDKPKVNPRIQKENPKVVTAADIEDLGDKVVYCRCWRSRKFPLCDGSHGRHNEETGDNVGPLVLKRREPTSS